MKFTIKTNTKFIFKKKKNNKYYIYLPDKY